MGDRRRFDRTQLRGPTDWFAAFLATAGGAGLAPFAPGTCGTLVGVAIVFASADLSWMWQATIWSSLFLLGVWAAGRLDRLMQTSDNQNIVIDEVLGVAVAALPFPVSVSSLALAFVLFRIFDILKPPPVRWIDQVTKRHPGWSAFGVIADDLAAGVQALLVMLVLHQLGFFT